MNRLLFKKALFIALASIITYILFFNIKNIVFTYSNSNIIFDFVTSLFSNTYFSGTLCSILAVIIIYLVQVKYSKKMLKKDFRCNEIMQDIFLGINNYSKIKSTIPKTKKINNDNIDKKEDLFPLINFYEKNNVTIESIVCCFTRENNNILIDSVESCFFINLNFKLLNIVNNIKNRIPNLKNVYREIKELYIKYKSGDTSSAKELEGKLHFFCIDLHYMSLYWQSLLEFLKFDFDYSELLLKVAEKYYIEYETQSKTIDEIISILRRDIKNNRKNKLKDKIKQLLSK